jgi:soluble lytic murein transglycosylase
MTMYKYDYLFKTLTIVMTLCLLASHSFAEPLSEQRQQYMDARAALAKGDTKTFRFLASQLKDYPLYPYLEYEQLRKNIRYADEQAIRDFLDNYSFLPVADQLRSAWLDTLMKRGQHQVFRKYYQTTGNTAHDCFNLHAQMAQGETLDATQQVQALWLVGHSQPEQCDPLFTWFEKTGHLTQDLIWQRIDLAMEKGQINLAKYLSRKLPAEQSAWFTVWHQVHNNPGLITQHKALQADISISRKIIAYGAKRLVRKDTIEGVQSWRKLKPEYNFQQELINEVESYLALTAALRHHPLAAELMSQLPDDIADTEVQEWRARTAMRVADWPAVLRSIVLMDDEAREKLEWQYWHARALEEMGVYVDAKSRYKKVAAERDYYGFLAADRVQQGYEMNYHPLQFTNVQIDSLLKHPALIRARELYAVGQRIATIREWNQLVANSSPLEVQMIAFIAHQWDWYDTAIFTVAKAQHYDDLTLRFPRPYDTIVFKNAKRFSLQPEYVYGIIRQESAFNVNARSGVGASGLMQLMPATAKEVALSLNKESPSRANLLLPTTNVELGSKYLRLMLDRYQDQQALAAAAYNAGPHRVKRWLPADKKMAADVWVDTIPFDETRKYVRRVMDYSTVYQWKIAQKTTRLQTRMPPVPTK